MPTQMIKLRRILFISDVQLVSEVFFLIVQLFTRMFVLITIVNSVLLNIPKYHLWSKILTKIVKNNNQQLNMAYPPRNLIIQILCQNGLQTSFKD